LTKSALARALRQERQSIDNWENGRNEPRGVALVSILEFFEIDDYLFFYSDKYSCMDKRAS